MDNPIYRNLIHHKDIIMAGDEYLDQTSNRWLPCIQSIGLVYDNRFYVLHRRVDIRLTNINELLNNNE